MGENLRLEFDRRQTALDRVQERLALGPATNLELNKICFRYGARIHELRKRGCVITKETLSPGVFRYTLAA